MVKACLTKRGQPGQTRAITCTLRRVFDWLNQVDRGFDLITEQAIRRGSFESVRQSDSCKANGVGVYRYLTDLFKTFSQARSVGGYEISLLWKLGIGLEARYWEMPQETSTA